MRLLRPLVSTARSALLRSAAVLAALCALPVPSTHGQESQPEWRAYTSLREVTALSGSATHVWAATTGGVFSQAIEGGETRRYSLADGLNGLSATAIAYDPTCGDEGCVWVGYQSGVLDRIDVGSGTVTGFRDIARAGSYPSRKINRLSLRADSLLIATDFGVVVFDEARHEVVDTYDQFGSLEMATATHDVVIAPGPDGRAHLWVATARGVARASLAMSNLQDPSSWIVETQGLPSLDVRSLALFQGTIYAGTATGLAQRDTEGNYTKLALPNEPVHQLVSTSAALLGVDPYDVLIVRSEGEVVRARPDGYERLSSLLVRPEGDAWFGSRNAGLVPVRIDVAAPAATVLRDCASGEARCYPASPYNSQFVNLEIDPSGNLWAGGTRAGDAGFHRLDADGNWTDFVKGRMAEITGGGYTRIHAAPDGSFWAGSEGAGAVQVTPDGEVVSYGRTNSSLLSPEGETNRDFIIAGGIASDTEGRVWVTSAGSSKPLNVRASDGTWTGLNFPNGCGGFTNFSGTLRYLVADDDGQLWISVIDKNNYNRRHGLMVLDTRNTPTDQSDDACQVFHNEPGRGEGLPSDSVNVVVEDGDGYVWVGTDQGVAYTLNTGLVALDEGAVFTWPLLADRSQGTYVLQGLRINDLAVDAANRIWAATNNGLWQIGRRDDGYEEIAHFTMENSPLLSDEVLSVAVHPATGEVFAATSEGLVSYQGDAIAASEAATDLFVFPNPVIIPSGGEPEVHIRNLVDATEVMITTADGVLVDRFAARGGQVLWNARDSAGQPVPSGVYLIVAVGQNGEGTAYGKVAVIR